MLCCLSGVLVLGWVFCTVQFIFVRVLFVCCLFMVCFVLFDCVMLGLDVL